MEYLSQPFKLDNSGLESSITMSMRLIFMKRSDSVPTESPAIDQCDDGVIITWCPGFLLFYIGYIRIIYNSLLM